jgi:hypothetical protein
VSNRKGSGLFCCCILNNSLRTEARSWTRFEVLESESTAKGYFRGGIVRPTEDQGAPSLQY